MFLFLLQQQSLSASMAQRVLIVQLEEQPMEAQVPQRVAFVEQENMELVVKNVKRERFVQSLLTKLLRTHFLVLIARWDFSKHQGDKQAVHLVVLARVSRNYAALHVMTV